MSSVSNYNETIIRPSMTSDSKWSSTTRTAFGPRYLTKIDPQAHLTSSHDYQKPLSYKGSNSFNKPLRRELRRHSQFVEKARSGSHGYRKGPGSLQDAAVKCMMSNLSFVTPELLKVLPVQIVSRLWAEMQARELSSFKLWHMFSSILCHHKKCNVSLLRYRQSISNPTLPLSIYTTPLISDNFEFITCLTIATEFTIPELAKLSCMKNLGVLELYNTLPTNRSSTSTVDDHLVRAWSSQAATVNAFPILRLLRLSGYHITKASLNYLNGFPSLAVFDSRGCSLQVKPQDIEPGLGWSHRSYDDPEEVTHILHLKSDHEYDSSVSNCTAEPIWDGAPVSRIPMHEQSRKVKFEGGPTCPLSAAFEKQDLAVLSAASISKSWDLLPYEEFCAIGAIREDCDLRLIGADTSIKTVASGRQKPTRFKEGYSYNLIYKEPDSSLNPLPRNHRIVCGIPVAMICLGENASGNRESQPSLSSNRDKPVCTNNLFYRFSPHSDAKNKENNLDPRKEDAIQAECGTTGDSGTSKKAKPMRKRKQKCTLDALLSSFGS